MTRGASRMSWLQEPCVFLHKTSSQLLGADNVCECCHEEFTFWNGRSNCEFCGCLVHSKCTIKFKTAANRKTRVCRTCNRYKEEYSPLLRIGDEFICYNNTLPAASYVYLSEEKRSLLITVDPTDVITEIPLSDVKYIQKGFTHIGHLNAGNQYDPIRCFSISTEKHSYNLKSHSGLHCQLWVIGLNTALFIHARLLEQEQAIQQYTGSVLPDKCIYFPDTGSLITQSQEDSLVIINNDDNISPDLVVIDVDHDMSRGSTPCSDMVDVTMPTTSETRTSPVVRKSHYKIRTIASPYKMVVPRKSPQPSWDTVSNNSTSDWRTKTTESTMSTGSCGLPYKGYNNPLASYCTCHAYAIEPSSAMLVSSNSSTLQDNDPYKTCCQQCRDKCRLLRDLSLF